VLVEFEEKVTLTVKRGPATNEGTKAHKAEGLVPVEHKGGGQYRI